MLLVAVFFSRIVRLSADLVVTCEKVMDKNRYTIVLAILIQCYSLV